MNELTYEVADHVGLITLNRPAQKNAFTVEMIDEWASIIQRATTDESVRVLVVTGAGSAFCAGADTAKMADDADDAERRRISRLPINSMRYLAEHIHQVAYALERFDKPAIAAVNGPAVGAGMDLALMCDMRVASESARFAEAYIRAGLIPGNGGCYFLPRLVGMAKALELLLTGEFVDAHEAHRIGLVNRVVPEGTALEEAMRLAQRLASSPPVHVQMTKRIAYESAGMNLRASLNLTAAATAIVRSMDDSIEALAAFREKRPGSYTGQ